MRFAAPVDVSMTSCTVVDVSTPDDSTTADSCTSKVGEFGNSTTADSCTSKVGEFVEDTCETIGVDLAPALPKMPVGTGSSARKSKLSRFRQGRQRDRRALHANTEKDLELLRQFEVEIGSSRARQRARELQLRGELALGTSTTVDQIAD